MSSNGCKQTVLYFPLLFLHLFGILFHLFSPSFHHSLSLSLTSKAIFYLSLYFQTLSQGLCRTQRMTVDHVEDSFLPPSNQNSAEKVRRAIRVLVLSGCAVFVFFSIKWTCTFTWCLNNNINKNIYVLTHCIHVRNNRRSVCATFDSGEPWGNCNRDEDVHTGDAFFSCGIVGSTCCCLFVCLFLILFC